MGDDLPDGSDRCGMGDSARLDLMGPPGEAKQEGDGSGPGRDRLQAAGVSGRA